MVRGDWFGQRSMPIVQSHQSNLALNHGAYRRTRYVGYDILGTMKALFSIFLALGVFLGSVQAGPVRTAKNVAKGTAITAKNVAHSAVKGTRRAVHTVVNTFTP